MITLKNVKTLKGKVENVHLKSDKEEEIDGKGKLTMLPALIDGHVHFRTPGHEHKETWEFGAKAAIAGGVTTVCDMPNNSPACVDAASMQAKRELIDKQLLKAGIPLRYYLYLGADKDHIEELGRIKRDCVALKIYMGSSTGGLVMSNAADLAKAFRVAAQGNIIVAVHAEDEQLIRANKARYSNEATPEVHSKIRNRDVAIRATEQAISLAEKYNAQLFILHVSTKEELDLIREAKKRSLLVYAETTPHHLFLSEDDYQKWGTKVQVNPPIRTRKDQEALWEAIHDRTIDTIGSDHAPHTLEEKELPYGKAPSGVPGIETMLPLLLNAANEGKISLEQIVHLTRLNIEKIYNLEHNSDVVLVDMELEKVVKDGSLKTKCGWSPFTGRTLKGWPVYTILRGNIYNAG